MSQEATSYSQQISILENTVKSLIQKKKYLKAFIFSEKILKLMIQAYTNETILIQYVSSISYSANTQSTELLETGKHKTCLALLKKVENLLLGFSCKTLAMLINLTYNNLACSYKKTGKLPLALESLEKGLEICLKYNETDNIAISHLNISAILSQMGNHRIASEHSNKAAVKCQQDIAKLNLQLKKSPELISVRQDLKEKFSLLGIANYNIGVQEEFLGNYNLATGWYKKACETTKNNQSTDPKIAKTFLKALKEVQAKATKILSNRRKRPQSSTSSQKNLPKVTFQKNSIIVPKRKQAATLSKHNSVIILPNEQKSRQITRYRPISAKVHALSTSSSTQYIEQQQVARTESRQEEENAIMRRRNSTTMPKKVISELVLEEANKKFMDICNFNISSTRHKEEKLNDDDSPDIEITDNLQNMADKILYTGIKGKNAWDDNQEQEEVKEVKKEIKNNPPQREMSKDPQKEEGADDSGNEIKILRGLGALEWKEPPAVVLDTLSLVEQKDKYYNREENYDNIMIDNAVNKNKTDSNESSSLEEDAYPLIIEKTKKPPKKENKIEIKEEKKFQEPKKILLTQKIKDTNAETIEKQRQENLLSQQKMLRAVVKIQSRYRMLFSKKYVRFFKKIKKGDWKLLCRSFYKPVDYSNELSIISLKYSKERNQIEINLQSVISKSKLYFIKQDLPVGSDICEEKLKKVWKLAFSHKNGSVSEDSLTYFSLIQRLGADLFNYEPAFMLIQAGINPSPISKKKPIDKKRLQQITQNNQAKRIQNWYRQTAMQEKVFLFGSNECPTRKYCIWINIHENVTEQIGKKIKINFFYSLAEDTTIIIGYSRDKKRQYESNFVIKGYNQNDIPKILEDVLF